MKVAPEVRAVASQLSGTAKVAEVDCSRENVGAYKIRAVPTFVIFQRGKEIDRRSGYASSKDLYEWVSERL